MRAAKAAAQNSEPGGGIENIYAARRGGSLPSKAELQQRTSALIAHHCPPRESTPADVFAADTQLMAESGSSMTFEGLQRRCDEIMEEGTFEPTEAEQACGPDMLMTEADVYDGSQRHGSLLDGDFDEDESAQSFQAALSAFRGGQLAMEADRSE